MDCGHEIVYRYTGTAHTWGITCECGGMYEPNLEGEKKE